MSLIKGHLWGICQALSPDQRSHNSCILNTPSGKRTSSFVFQVGSTMDVTYLTRSIHASFKDSIGTVGVSTQLSFFSQWFRLMSAEAVDIAALHFFFTTGPEPIIKTTSRVACVETQYILVWQQWFVSCSAPAHVFPSRNRCPLRLAQGGPWNALCPTTMALSLIAYFLE